MRLNITTTTDITRTLAASSGKSAPSAAALICAPRPWVSSTWPLKVTYSATMLAFHAPPAAVTQPVTRYGNTAGKYRSEALASGSVDSYRRLPQVGGHRPWRRR